MIEGDRLWLEALGDIGASIHVPDSAKFTPQGRRLLVSLGVVEEDPLRVEVGTLARRAHGVQDARDPLRPGSTRGGRVTETSAADVGRSYDCQTPNCTNQARSRVGRYSYCDECRARRDEQQRKTGVPASLAERLPAHAPPASPARASAAGSSEASVKELVKLGHQVDRAFAAAKRKAEAALRAKADAEVLQRRFRALGRELFGGDEA